MKVFGMKDFLSWVFNFIRKQRRDRTIPNIYFYRDKDQREIDFIFENNGILYPVEVKKTATPSLANIKSFSAIENFKKPIGEGAVICLYKEIFPLNKNVILIPVGTI